ncbi:MAG: lytic murein transglycosylase B [Gammaproteobacteria bacterium]|nr:lytic murein transglycosylase B [Gammaproteobacteria bacterium]MCB1902535.1 lytic murein transglycosylase B [Gammaproteobacteria bacterium]
MQHKLHKILPLLAALLIVTADTASAAKPQSFDADVEKFVSEMNLKYGLGLNRLRELMGKVTYQQSIIDAITRPAEAKPWAKYRPIFITPSRIAQGVEFWNENTALLERAEQVYGVPAQLIVAIIGVETRYGRNIGKYPVVDALSTLAFGYPKRAEFFRRELAQFLLLIQEERIEPDEALGSYAGAMGLPQFIPSSYRAYAVDFDGDGQRDLWHSKADVIGSVAAYFKQHGWKRGGDITTRVSGVESRHDPFVEAGMKPSFTFGKLRKTGVRSEQPVADDALASLIRLDGETEYEHWLGLHNFYVITRYNHSNLYAMAVYQLSREILSERGRQAQAENRAETDSDRLENK